jgi:hypothetical protein
LAGGSEADAARQADEERCAERGLHTLEVAGQGGLDDVEGGRGTSDAAQLGHPQHHLDVAQIEAGGHAKPYRICMGRMVT